MSRTYLIAALAAAGKGKAVTLQVHKIELTGNLGLREADGIRQQLLDALGGESDIKVDMADLTGIDMSVVQVLIAGGKLARDRGRPFEISAIADGPLHNAMTRAGLGRSVMPFDINWQMKDRGS